MQLSDRHKQKLIEESGLNEETLDNCGWWSASPSQVADVLGWKKQPDSGGIVIPYPNVKEFKRVRMDNPLEYKGREIKYLSKKGSRNYPYIPKTVTPILNNPNIVLYITEGEKKAEKATQEGFPCIALPGVWGFITTITDGYTEPRKKKVMLPELEQINWQGRVVRIIFDSDARGNDNVQKAGKRLAALLRQRKADAQFFILPSDDDSSKNGLDDYLVKHGPKAFEAFMAQAAAETSAENRNFEIDQIEKLLTEPPIYRVTVFGKQIKLNAQDLANFQKFKRLVLEATDRVPKMKKPAQEWDGYLDDVLATKLKVVEAPEEASPEAIMWESVLQYIKSRMVEDETALAEKRGVYKNENYVYFHGPTLHRYMKQREHRIEARELWDVLRKYGAESRTKKVRDSTERWVTVKAWRVPLDIVEEENSDQEPEEEKIQSDQEFTEEEEEEDIF